MKKGQVYLVVVTGSRGHEQSGTRPAVIMGEANGLATVIPLTGNRRAARFSHTYSLEPTKKNGLKMESIAMVFQIVSLDISRFVHSLGNLSQEEQEAIDALAKDLLDL